MGAVDWQCGTALNRAEGDQRGRSTEYFDAQDVVGQWPQRGPANVFDPLQPNAADGPNRKLLFSSRGRRLPRRRVLPPAISGKPSTPNLPAIRSIETKSDQGARHQGLPWHPVAIHFLTAGRTRS